MKAVAAALVVLIAGCTSQISGLPSPPPPGLTTVPPGPTSPPPPTTAPTPSPTTSPTPSASPQPPPLTGQPMTAADGRNTRACLDGRCEVLVSVGTRITFTHSNGRAVLDIIAIGPSGLTMTLVSTALTGNIESGPLRGQFMKLNDVGISALAVRGTAAVLRLTRG